MDKKVFKNLLESYNNIYTNIKATKERYVAIGEASQILETETYTLRFWEEAIPSLKIKKTTLKNRGYSKKNLIVLLRWKFLLKVKGYTIEGAKFECKNLQDLSWEEFIHYLTMHHL